MAQQQEIIYGQLSKCLSETDYDFLGAKYAGKVRDNYTRGTTRFLVTSDRLSCFDVVVTTIPFKGQVLNQMAAYWFEHTSHIIPNHLMAVPDPNVMVVKLCQVLPVEVIVRAYLAGSAYRDYIDGKAISGNKIPGGLKQHEKLPELLVTPSTKAEKGQHDLPISEREILERGLLEPELWQQIKTAALSLFRFGQEEALKRGLILADTKYEFGLADGELVLVDEIHTLDSSRYWAAESYPERFRNGESPEMLDKEPTRQWLLSRGYKGEGKVPEFTDEHRVSISQHYIDSFQRITGLKFEPRSGGIEQLIKANLQRYLDDTRSD
ncbi:MAG: phosphoribosylaminoimidazolesuccinocarboxamide synthase [Proteobacteria bacterium]|nr:MAG: phosphoribosylaminoimidazolesuccinocarboxamide synthase [Pseudomonadota bacterium]